jgi:psiF repeat
MKGFVARIGVSVLIFGLCVHAAHSQSSQQEVMKTCNAQAGSQKLTGDARKSFYEQMPQL